nr:helix-turn-helix domain-containing protein [Pseudomonadota bacterium]
IKGWSQRELARRAGVSQKTISNLENVAASRESPKMDIVERVANAFGQELWQLLIPEETERLIVNYTHASPNGRQHIDRIAELEAKYGQTS